MLLPSLYNLMGNRAIGKLEYNCDSVWWIVSHVRRNNTYLHLNIYKYNVHMNETEVCVCVCVAVFAKKSDVGNEG